MELALPLFGVIKSKVSGHYACYKTGTEDKIVRATEKNVFSTNSKVQFETAKTSSKYVHIRFCHSNKYWAKAGFYIAADASEPNEDTNNQSCTLFEATISDMGVLFLTHVQSKMRVVTDVNHAVGLDITGQLGEVGRSFHVVDWESLVMLPKNVAFKGDNGKFLKFVWVEGYRYLQFSSTDGNETEAAFEVTMNPDGDLVIKSVHSGLYWRLSPNWIWADSDNPSDKNCLFSPVKYDDSTICLRTVPKNRFCKRLTTEGKTDCLNAGASSMVAEARLKVEELVLERHVYDVNYRLEDARVYGLTPVVAGYNTAENTSKQPATMSIKVGFKQVSSRSFKYNLTLKLGVKTTVETGVPLLFEGKIEISAELTNSFEWNTTTSLEEVGEAAYTGQVPAESRVTIHYMATKGTCDVPFSYRQRDKSSIDGKTHVSEHIDGIFTGVNYYGFHFKQAKVEPI